MPADIAGATRAIRGAMADLQWNLQRAIESIEGVTAEALHYGLLPIYEESQRLVPVDTGALKASGYLEVETRSDNIIAEVGYARGGQPFYAVIVHENLEFHHKDGTQAKFLEHAIDLHLDEVQPRIVEYMKGALNL